ncbi:MAG TPA: FtsX-like permease family protein, partial [Roseivirga sp.]
MISSYLKFAFKSVKKHKVPSLINFFGFTIGLSGSLLLLAILFHDLNFDGYHKGPKEIYRLSTKLNFPNGSRHFASSSVLTHLNLSESIAEIESEIRTRYLTANLTVGDQIFTNEAMLFVDSSYYQGFRVELIEGHLPKGNSDVLINVQTKERLFGDTLPIGEIIEAQGPFGRRSFQVAGVFKDYPTNVSFRPTILADFKIIEPIHNTNYASITPGLLTYIITNNQVENQELQSKINAHFQNVLPENLREVILHEAQDYSSIHFINGLEFDMGQKHNKQTLWILGVLATFIIASTFINFFNMQTALVVQRQRELSIKKTLGQSWWSRTLQTALEALILLLPTVVISGLLVNLALTELEAFTNLSLKEGVFSEQLIWWFMLAILVVFWTITSIASIVLLRLNSKSLSAHKVKSGDSIFRKALIGLQFALAGFFILNALVISSQLNYITALDLGFKKEGLINISLSNVQGYEHAKT